MSMKGHELAFVSHFPELSDDFAAYFVLNGKSYSANELQKYPEKRDKNNKACQESRRKRKQKMKETAEELDRMKQVNAALVERVKELEKLLQLLADGAMPLPPL